MPNLRERFIGWRDNLYLQSEYQALMRGNIAGYRNYRAAKSDLRNVDPKNPYARDYLTLNNMNKWQASLVFRNAGKNNLGFMVIGRAAVGNLKGRVSTEDYPIIDTALANNMGSLGPLPSELGSVLNTSHWTLYMNDMMIAGGVAGRIPFYLASRRSETTLWDKFENRPTLFARELVGLLYSGYEIIRLQDNSEALVPTQRTERLTISNYMSALPEYFWKDLWPLIKVPKLRSLTLLENRRFMPEYYE